MPDAEAQTPSATAVADPPAASPPESTAQAASPAVGSPTSFDAIFAQALAGIPKDDPTDTALSGETKPADPAPAVAQDDKPAPSDDAGVKASDETTGEADEAPPEPGKPLSRRQQIAADKDAEIARLSALVAERDPEAIKTTLREQVRAELEAEQTRKATEAVDEDFLGNQERFDRLARTPYAQFEGDDDEWYEIRKQRRTQYAPVERHIRSIYEQQLADARANDQTSTTGLREEILSTVGSQISDMASLPGVDSSSWKTPGRTFADYGRSLYDGGKATGKAEGAAEKETELSTRVQKAETETARLKKDNEDLRLQIMGATPAPHVAGRSASGTPSRPQADPSGSWQDNLGAAFGWGPTTH